MIVELQEILIILNKLQNFISTCDVVFKEQCYLLCISEKYSNFTCQVQYFCCFHADKFCMIMIQEN